MKFHAHPSWQYERVLTDYYKSAKSTRDPIKHKAADEFIAAILDRLKRNRMIEPKGMYRDTWGLSEKGRAAAKKSRKGLPALRKKLTPGISRDLVYALALDTGFKRLFLEPFRYVCDIRLAGHASGRDWFSTLWGSRSI